MAVKGATPRGEPCPRGALQGPATPRGGACRRGERQRPATPGHRWGSRDSQVGSSVVVMEAEGSCSTVRCSATRVRSGQGQLEKSGEIRKRFPVTRKSGNIDYSPIVREFENSWVEHQNSAHNRLFFVADKKQQVAIIG